MVALLGQVMDIVIAPRRNSTRKSAPADFDVMGGHQRWRNRQRQRDEFACLRGRLGVIASGQLAPAMNDVGIDTVCHGDLGESVGPNAKRRCKAALTTPSRPAPQLGLTPQAEPSPTHPP